MCIYTHTYTHRKALIILDKMDLTYTHANGAESDFKVLTFYTPWNENPV